MFPLSCLSRLVVGGFACMLVGGLAPILFVGSSCRRLCLYPVCRVYLSVTLYPSYLSGYLLVALPLAHPSCRLVGGGATILLVPSPISCLSCLLAGGSAPILGLGDVMTQSRPMKGRVKEI